MKHPLLSYEAALTRLLDAARVQGKTEMVGLLQAQGRILAAPLLSDCAVPPHDNSAMDGYALRCADVAAAGTRLQVAQRIAAGATGSALQAGTAARIFTGAPIPPGADAVVMQERCRADGDGVWVDELPRLGQNIRRAGEDILQGAVVIEAGRQLGAAHIGLAASVGATQLLVHRPLRVAVFFTGDELREPGEALPAGAIYNSNRYVLRALLDQLGCQVTDLGIVRDDAAKTREALRSAAAGHDVVITCGGVSVGEEDHVKAAVEAEGALSLWKIAIKPGKPLAFGRVGEADFIGLPGNPVSAYVTFLTLVQPFLRKRQGRRGANMPPRRVKAGFEWPRADDRREFLRAQIDEAGRAVLFPKQGSGVLTSCAWAHGLVVLAPSQTVAIGDEVQFLSVQELT
ncbi:molybdopterin molybdotransferase MoeA [Niveibacterium sp. 24ML]|uniref:molybdopterin molybdotransferase MoeA n=1 Tax=Niveibacterium sp. 24ML TaxID=2985512 RepID=UPI002270E390|nr:gephyrin-like molybdotransferase Glp [Niveibacterium sp. 24ML]MCX9156678.1 molybdopterin molybdotransferase MoeA [Niveibacterium sp. 24ML]